MSNLKALPKDWKSIVLSKREALFARIPEAWRLSSVPAANELRDAVHFPRQFMSERAYDITETLDARALLDKIASGHYTAYEVVEAFCHRAAIAQQVVNCLTEINFEDALARARELDDYFRVHERTIGPLHGLPVSLKDQFRVKGTNAALGLVSFIDAVDTSETESFLVKELRDLGAIIYVKTTVPTAVSHIDCHNNVTGQTYSPVNRFMSSGGSSGGEGALIAMHGSIIGIGTDIGASTRLPAAVNGIYGIRPSHGRLPYLGVRELIVGNTSAPFVPGPLGAKLSNIQMMTEAILGRKPWIHDPRVAEMPWRVSEYEDIHERGKHGDLVFGILTFDGGVMPQPPILRALKEVVNWAPPAHTDGSKIMTELFVADGGAKIHEAHTRSGEPPNSLVTGIFGKTAIEPMSLADFFDVNERRYRYQQAYTEYWNSTARLTKSGRPVDAVILPTFPGSSFRPGDGLYYDYTAIVNLLDYTAAIVPWSHVDKNKDLLNFDYKAATTVDRLIHSHYDPEIFDGAPVALQIMGRRFQEERVLAVAKVIDELAYLGAHSRL
ncbi:amidase signature domain-containing protein [Vararia minispora EC-137]|uniref:Amidase signature domain-containing protein n=1 Tax=Vararia minispora EC-137 TaxID=1314806 RepID=A0ACB8QJS9_9AGAM|nr:amidase signature domain-containing protein [Vararia minispora EC-137]